MENFIEWRKVLKDFYLYSWIMQSNDFDEYVVFMPLTLWFNVHPVACQA